MNNFNNKLVLDFKHIEPKIRNIRFKIIKARLSLPESKILRISSLPPSVRLTYNCPIELMQSWCKEAGIEFTMAPDGCQFKFESIVDRDAFVFRWQT